MAEGSPLLSTQEMARFVARGFLRFDALVPPDINRRFIDAYDERGLPAIAAGTTADEAWPQGSPLAELYALPRLTGIVDSLVGPGCLFDHHFLHVRGAERAPAQHIHQDSTIDPRLHFDVQLLYFPQKVSREMGGTYFLPGSHFRRVNEASISRYQNIVGTQHVACEAGTVFALHMGIWHGGGYNESGERRLMYKVRLNPAVRQRRLWNTDDIPDDIAAPTTVTDNRHG